MYILLLQLIIPHLLPFMDIMPLITHLQPHIMVKNTMGIVTQKYLRK